MPELDRRHFLKLVGAGAGAAASAGCSDPVEKLIPYVIQPESITPGLSVDYASTCRECPAGCGVHVTTREGRPIKIEGNPDHPINRGKLCARGQAAIARTYHPDRYTSPQIRVDGTLRGASWEEALGLLTNRLQGLREKRAISKLRVLGRDPGPALGGLIDTWIAALGGSADRQRLVFEPFEHAALRRATGAVFGVEVLPEFDLSGADLILDFGSDFLDSWISPVEHTRQFSEARAVRTREGGGARLVSIHPRLSLTGSSADQWIPAAPGSEGGIALALAKAVYERARRQGREIRGDSAAVARALSGVDPAEVARRAGIDRSTLDRLTERLLKAKSPLALPPGVAASSTRATAAVAAVLLLDALLGAVGKSVKIPKRPLGRRPAGMAEIAKLVADMKAGRVDTLLIHDADPLYSLPADSGFAEALQNVALVVSSASLMDETSERAAHLVLPDHTLLESWGDAQPRASVRSLIQPTVRPLHDSQALGDSLLAVGRNLGKGVADRLPAGSFRSVVEAAWQGSDFRAALARGGEFGGGAAWASGAIATGVGNLEFKSPRLEGSGEFVLMAYPHSFLGDGRGAAMPWLQETPDPIAKAAWQSWAELSKETAEKLGVDFGDMVTIETGFGAERIEVPVYPRGGIRHDVVAVAIGQGHTVGHYASLAGDGQPGEARGASVISILPARRDESGGRAWLTTRASVSPTGAFRRIPLTQWTDNQRERGLAQEISLVALLEGGGEHAGEHGDAHHGAGPDGHFQHTARGMVSPYERENDADPASAYRWGMTIDNDRCTGCSACVVACAIENNIPVVGEEGVSRHREMSWIRIERFVGEGEVKGGEKRRPYPNREELGEVEVRHALMLCQHCGAAPCEAVCPVLATYHTPEGINGMVYNRCVGTRYCANNCVYKVRRFNYFDYSGKNWPGLLGLMLNPDVTVRGQGVMEKCTFCIQRIQAARQPAKDEGRDIRDGEVTTACQQSCPAQAITFGNTRDSGSQVNTVVDADRAYHSLYSLNTRPAITYLKQVKREADERSHS